MNSETKTDIIKADDEIVKNFHDHTGEDQLSIIIAHKYHYERAGFNRELQLFMRLFNLGNPKCTVSKKMGYARVEQESVDVMRVIFRNYLI